MKVARDGGGKIDKAQDVFDHMETRIQKGLINHSRSLI